MAARKSTRRSRSHKTPAVAYYRMSSDKQEASIPAQIKAVEHYAEQHGFEILRDYRDEGISGDATEKRLDFQRMMADVSAGDFEVVLCWDQDRFGRFDPIEGGYWIKPMRDAEVRLETVAQGPIDWNDFAGRIVWTVHQEAKNSYLSDLSRNVLRGHVEKAQRGEWSGGKPPYGYRAETKRLTFDDPDRVELVRGLFRDYLNGQSLRSLAGCLNRDRIPGPSGRALWTGNGIRAILTNRVYLGEFRWNAISRGKYNRVVNGHPEKSRAKGRTHNDESQMIVIPDNHPAMVERQQFDEVQERLVRNRTQTSPAKESKFLLTSRVVCGACGCKMHGCTDSGKQKYSCSGNTKHGSGFCFRNTVAEDKLIGLLCDSLHEQLLAPDRLAELRQELKRQCRSSERKSQAKALERQLTQIDAKLTAAQRRLLEVDPDMLDAVQEQIRDIRCQRERIDHRLQEALTPEDRRLADHDRRIERAEQLLGSLRDAVKRADRKLAREFLAALIERVELQFHSEKRGSRRFNHLTSGTVTLSGSASRELCGHDGRTSLGGIIGAITSGSRGL